MSKKLHESPITNEKKSEALDFILENSFRSGFGTLSKTELDLILFTALMKYGESKSITDLELSKYLQITQKRIQNFKEKASVKYIQIERIDAIEEFVSKLQFAKKDDKYIDIPIKNISVKNEIEGILDEIDILLHVQLNSKIFRVRIDDLMEVILFFQAYMSTENTIEELRNTVIENVRKSEGKLKDLNQSIVLIDDHKIYPSLKGKLLKCGVDVGLEIMKAVVPGGGIAITIIDKLIDNFGALGDV